MNIDNAVVNNCVPMHEDSMQPNVVTYSKQQVWYLGYKDYIHAVDYLSHTGLQMTRWCHNNIREVC